MVQIQFFAFENLPAVLSGILVAFEDIMPSEFHFLLRHPIEQHQHNHARHPDSEGYRADALGMWLLAGDVVPLLEIVSLERAVRGV